MSKPAPSVLGYVTLVGPAVGRNESPLWWAQHLRVPYFTGSRESVIDNNFGLRVVLSEGDASPLGSAPKFAEESLEAELPRGNKTVAFLRPALLQGAVRPAADTQTTLVVDEGTDRFHRYSCRRVDDGWSEVVAAPLAPWPKAAWATGADPRAPKEPAIFLPPLRLGAGRVPVRLRPLADRDNVLGIDDTKILGLLKAKSKGKRELSGALIPEGIEFEVQAPAELVALAKSVAPGLPDEQILCAQLTPSASVGASVQSRSLIVRVVNGGRTFLDAIERALQQRFRQCRSERSPLRIDFDTRPVVPPLYWKVKTDKSNQPWEIDDSARIWIEPSALRVRFETEEPADEGGTADAEVRPAEVSVEVSSEEINVSIDTDEGAAQDANVTFRWSRQMPGITQPIYAEIKRGVPVAIDSERLAEELGTIYRSSGAMPQGETAAPYAFFPVARGWLQWPLRRLAESPESGEPSSALKPDAASASALVGFAAARLPGQLEHDDRRRVEVDAARRVRSVATWRIDDGQWRLRDVEISWIEAQGSVRGLLYAGLASPTPAEILPTLAAGPGATRDVPVRFGDTHTLELIGQLQLGETVRSMSLQRSSSPTADSQQANELPVVAWLADASLPLIAAAPMTRTVESGEPSRSRGLLPREINVTTAGAKLDFSLAGPPSLVLGQIGASWVRGWPWPIGRQPDPPGIAVVLPTLPGLEFCSNEPNDAKSRPQKVSLRFDLPVLDEYFAAVRVPVSTPILLTSVPEKAGPAVVLGTPAPTALDLDRLATVWQRQAEGLSLARTQGSRAVKWIACTPAPQEVPIDGLVEPYQWKPEFSFGEKTSIVPQLSIGEYALRGSAEQDSQRYWGSRALAGHSFQFGFSESEAEVAVKGFAPATYRHKEDKLLTDNRGFGQKQRLEARGPLLLRWAAFARSATNRENRENREKFCLATLTKPIAVLIGQTPSAFWFRDLPLVASDGDDTMAFHLNTNAVENAQGSSVRLFDRENLPFSLHEWRIHLVAGDDEKGRYEIPLGPFVFRPLRLVEVRATVANGDVTSLRVLGSLLLPGAKTDTEDGPFQVDQAYRSGNLVTLDFGASDGTLQAQSLTRVAVRDDRESDRVQMEPTVDPLQFCIDSAAVHLGRTPWVEASVKLSLRVAAIATTQDARPTIADLCAIEHAQLQAHLLGEDVSIGGVPLRPPGDADAFAFDLVPPSNIDPARVGALVATRVRVSLASRPATIAVSGSLTIGKQVADTPLSAWQSLFVWWFDSDDPDNDAFAQWLGAKIKNIILLDHDHERHSVLALGTAPEPRLEGEVIRNFGLCDSVHAQAYVTVTYRRDTGWFSFEINTQYAELSAQSTGPDTRSLRHVLWSNRAGGIDSALTVTISPQWRRSRIEWPIASLTRTPSDAPIDVSGKAIQWTSRPDSNALCHLVETQLASHRLPLELLEIVEEPNGNRACVLARPWHIRSRIRHWICDPVDLTLEPASTSKKLCWTTVDYITVIDLDSLAFHCKEELGAAGAASTYAFSPRYRDRAYRGEDKKRNRQQMAHPGVARRALAAVGIPDHATAVEMWRRYEGGFRAKAWVFLGGGVSVIETTAVSNSSVGGDALAPPRGVILPLPWVAAVNEEIGELGALQSFAQRPKSQPRKVRVAAFDSAAGTEIALGLSTAVPLALGRLESEIEVSLMDIFRGADRSRERSVRMRRLASVEQPFVESSSNETMTEATLRELPLFARSLLALRAVWEHAQQLDASSLSTLLVEPTQGEGAPSLARVVRAAISEARSAVNSRSGEEGANQRAVELIVLGKDTVARASLGQQDGLIDTKDGVGRARLAAQAAELVHRPLAILVGEVEPASRWHPAELSRVPDFQHSHKNLSPIRSAGRVDAFGLEASSLRRRGDTLYASAALGWPDAPAVVKEGELPLSSLVLATEGSQPIQHEATALAGRSSVLAAVAHSPTPRDDPGHEPNGPRQAYYLWTHRRVVFERPVGAGTDRSPTARHLSLIPPRTRVPHNRSSMWPELARLAVTHNASDLAPLLPGPIERAILGTRPGVMYDEADAWIVASNRRAFDSQHQRFGSAGDVMPSIAAQVRSPRSSAFPHDEDDIELRRRTFVSKADRSGNALVPFRILEGPVSLFRVGDAECSVLIEVVERIGGADELRRLPEINEGFDGTLLLRVTASKGRSDGRKLEQVLAGEGLLSAGLLAELRAGSNSAFLRLGQWSVNADALVMTLVAFDHAAAKRVVAGASADSPPKLTLRCGPAGPGMSLPEGTLPIPPSSDSTPIVNLAKGPPRTVTIPLSIGVARRPVLPVTSALCVFGDPSYDRMLATRTEFGDTRVGDPPQEQRWMIACDRPEYDLAMPVHFAFGKVDVAVHRFESRDPRSDQPPPEDRVFLTLIPGDPKREKVFLYLDGVKSGRAEDVRKYHVIERGFAYALSLEALRCCGTDRPPEIVAGDYLKIAVQAKVPEVHCAVRVRIVAERVITTPPAIYGLITRESDGRCAVPLYASSPMAQVIEFPDLLADLAQGSVRRRGLFLWRFEPEDPNTHRSAYGAIIKVDRAGGGQMIDNENDFQPIE